MKRSIARTPTQLLAQARAPLLLSTPEATALELFTSEALLAELAGILGRARFADEWFVRQVNEGAADLGAGRVMSGRWK
ncbi:MAG: hypothetical protein ACREGK_03310, partial [Geminicoccales bacterium]